MLYFFLCSPVSLVFTLLRPCSLYPGFPAHGPSVRPNRIQIERLGIRPSARPPVREGNGREAAIAFAPVGWSAREGSDDKLGIRLDCS